MYFWDTDRLAALLAKEELGQGQKIRYYIACFYLQTASTVLPMYLFGLSYSLDVITLASYVASLVVFHLGALKVYKACAHYQKAGVLDTVIVLSLPVCIKVHSVYWLVYAVVVYALTAAEGSWYLWVIYSFSAMPIMVWFQFNLIRNAVVRNYG